MKQKLFIALLLLVLIAGMISACGGISDAEIAQTEDAIQSTSAAQSTGTVSAEETRAAVTQAFETEFAGTSIAVTKTESVYATSTAERATKQANARETLAAGTETAVAEATDAVSRIYPIVQELYEQGYISTTAGSFKQMPYWSDSYAMRFYVTYHQLVGFEATNFVMVMDVEWATASNTAEGKQGGCGITFRALNYYQAYYAFLLNLDGKIGFISKESSDGYVSITKAYWGPLDHMEGSTTFIITAEGNTFQVFNMDLERIDLRIGNALTSGGFAYVLASGTNEGFGTRCTFPDTELWLLDD